MSPPLKWLNDEDALARLAEHGPNRLAERAPHPAWLKFIDQFKSLLVIILISTAVLTGLAADRLRRQVQPLGRASDPAHADYGPEIEKCRRFIVYSPFPEAYVRTIRLYLIDTKSHLATVLTLTSSNK